MQCENCGKKVFANEKCKCGKKAPGKNNGIVHVNTIICFVILMLAVMSLVLTLSLRTTANKNLIVKSVEEVDLADIEIDHGKKLDRYIYDEFIDDPRITVENVDNLLKDPFIKDFIIEKVEAYQDFGFGGDEVPYITADEIVELIDKNSELLENEAGLRFLDADKEELRGELSALNGFERFSNDFLDTAIGSRFVQTFFSYANVVFEIVLMAVIFIQWLIVYKANDRRVSKMVYKYGIAVAVPSVLVLAMSVMIKISKDMEIADKLLGSAMTPFIAYSAALLALGIILTVIGILGSKTSENANVITAETSSAKPVQTASAAVQTNNRNANANICPNCSHQNKETSAFCSRCGTKLK
ncbi:MAG: zinc ribbon domain-containing protein [Clostridium sp.]|nr:zinc ribbon domain-containing protein [Clostridium sp.]